MQSSTEPITQDLVLIGGGHSHAIALKKFGMTPVSGVRVTLITDVFHTPYSGMLPGYVAGLYDFDQCHIDLRHLTQFAQARLIPDRAIGLDLINNRVICANRPPIAFDVLSIDIGSTPNVAKVAGAEKYAIPVKPISKFLEYWDQLLAEVRHAPYQPLHLGIVGGGTGGVELALNAQAHLQKIYREAGEPETNVTVHLFHQGAELLEERSAWVRQRVQAVLTERAIRLHLNEEVVEVTVDQVACKSGLTVKCDRLFWVTQASAASWVGESGLKTDTNGFIQVNDCLQSVSHPQVFAAGDIATMVHCPRPKAGVFAVRQGKPLFENLRHSLLGKPLHPFVPQKKFLILIGMGDRTAIASRGVFNFGPHPLIWQWKDRIDQRFMEQFTNLKNVMGEGKAEGGRWKAEGGRKRAEGGGQKDLIVDAQSLPLGRQRIALKSLVSDSSAMRCAGCGSKVSSSVLEKVLQRVKQDQTCWSNRGDILIGLDAPDDAAVVRVPNGQVMVQTVDYFRSLIDDPFLFGQISTNHCLSDIFAMGAMPQSALAIATLPYQTDAKTEETLYQLLSGATKALHESQAVLVGGHTTEGAELAFGLSCSGLAHPDQLLRKSGMQPGQALILTKALGTGTLFAADMRLKAKGRWIEAALESMLLSNQAAAACLQQYQATACTDVTGFGLLGHLVEMVLASHVAVELDLAAIPMLDGAEETLQQGIFSSLYPQNLRASQHIHNLEKVSDRPNYPILFDPQTSGGLLGAVPQQQAQLCLAALKAIGYTYSRIIGYTFPQQDTGKPVRIKV